MIHFSKDRMNVHSDNLKIAIIKKANNKALSSKSIEKLIKIANTQYGFKNAEAELIFSNIPVAKKSDTAKVLNLLEDINSIKGITVFRCNSFIDGRIAAWECNAKSLLEVKSKNKGGEKSIGEGSRGVVYKDGEFILKETQNMTPNEIAHEANMCNEYNFKKQPGKNAATITDNCIKMPFINGCVPDYQQTLSGVSNLFKQGFLIGDAKPANFLKTSEGNVEPVDFGLVFRRDELSSIDSEVKKNIIHDYLKGGFNYIPEASKEEYNACIRKLDESLGQDSPMRSMNIKVLLKAGFIKINNNH